MLIPPPRTERYRQGSLVDRARSATPLVAQELQLAPSGAYSIRCDYAIVGTRSTTVPFVAMEGELPRELAEHLPFLCEPVLVLGADRLLSVAKRSVSQAPGLRLG